MLEPNAIDTKKKENESSGNSDKPPDYAGFFSNIVLSVIINRIFISFLLVGSIGLYICKIAQANILPDNMEYIPFGSKPVQIEQIPINVNVVKEYGLSGLGWLIGETPKKLWSTKILFNIDNSETGTIAFIKSLQTKPKSASFFGLYISNIILSVISINNLIINKVFSIANEFLPESAIIILFPFVLIFLFIFFFILNIILCFFFQVKFWKDFFMDKNIKDNKVNWIEPFTYLRPWRAFLLFLYVIFLFFPMATMTPFILILYSFLSPLFISGENQSNKEPYNFAKFIKDVLLYKSQLFLIILSLGLIIDSNKYLGSNSMIGCIIGIIIVFFGLHLYNQYIPKNDLNLTPGLASLKPAKIRVAK
jgi:hypothetical protein